MKRFEQLTEAELRNFLKVCGMSVDTAAKHFDVETPRFVLMLFNDPKLAQYISNSSREETIVAMRETADRLEKELRSSEQ
jgi:hypothetical protein